MDTNQPNESFYWDQISTVSHREAEESIKDLFQSAFRFIEPFMTELFWIDQNFLYLNLVCGTPQQKIANMFGVSQLGVSKRVRSAIKKIRWKITKPEKDLNKLYDILWTILPADAVECMVMYYQYGTYSIVSEISLTKGFKTKIFYAQSMETLDLVANIQSKNDLIKIVSRIKSSKIDYVKRIEIIQSMDLFLFQEKIKQLKTYYENINKHVKYSEYSWKKKDGTRSK